MDQLTRNLLRDFIDSEGLRLPDQSAEFERFINYCVLGREFSGSFNVEDFSLGAGDDTGLDGIAILVNGSLVTSEEEI